MNQLSGSCMCGAVRYEVEGKFREIIGCHCLECRKSSGHFTAATSVKPKDLIIIKDQGLKWYRSSPSAQRGFCFECGSTLFWKPDSGDRISLFVGAVDTAVTLPLTSHIYVEEKGNYYEIVDGAKQYMQSGAKLAVV